MIDLSLELICARLNAHLRKRFGADNDLVCLSPLVELDGQRAGAARNKLALFLVNVARDPVSNSTNRSLGHRENMAQTEPLHLDIFFMLASGHDGEMYTEGLKLISEALSFFQSNPVFTPQNTPEMPKGLMRLSIEICNLELDQIGPLWSGLSAPHVPSVMFKMRSMIDDDAEMKAATTPITAIGVEL